MPIHLELIEEIRLLFADRSGSMLDLPEGVALLQKLFPAQTSAELSQEVAKAAARDEARHVIWLSEQQ